MEQQCSIDDLYMKAHCSDWILPKILQQAKTDKGNPFEDAKITEYFGLPEEFLRRITLSEPIIKRLQSVVKMVRKFDKKSPSDEEAQDVSVQEAEAEIAEKLRKCCDIFGRERAKMLGESAQHLLDLGKLHMKNAICGEGVQQKLNFIRSAALISGAIVRFQKVMDQDKLEIASIEMQRLYRHIFEIACIKGDHNLKLLEFSSEIKRVLQEDRQKIAEKLDAIIQIPKENDDGDKRLTEEPMKTAQLREICEQSTKYYLDLLRKIAEKCGNIMGEPPCEFVVVGLGSLARKEATLYSDFEHVIVLDDVDISSAEKEYFRWFTTIFHIIIIGLGETVIPSVNIRSLCDLYATDKSKKWFVDEQTPLGISFDGMMPHACKIPLGRPQETKLRKHTVELIQPISTMASFLTQEEEIKNGYFLSDVLSKTCFVYGSQKVYDSFFEKSHEVISNKTREDVGKQQLKNILLNPNESIHGSKTVNSMQSQSVKASIYRPITALLSCIATLHGIKSHSSFEIVDEMKKLTVIDEVTHQMLMSIVTVAMEVRMKAYRATGHQRGNLIHSEVAIVGGKEQVIDCHIAMSWLTQYAQTIAYEFWNGVENDLALSLPPKSSAYWRSHKIRIMQIFSTPEEFVRHSLEFVYDAFTRFRNNEITAVQSKSLLKLTFKGMVLSFAHFCLKVHSDINKWEWATHMLFQLAENTDFRLLQVYHSQMFVLRYMQDKFEESLQEYEKWRQFLLKLPSKNTVHDITTVSTHLWLLRIVPKALDKDHALEYFAKMFDEESDFEAKLVLRIGICQCLIRKMQRSSAEEKLEALATDVNKNARAIGRFTYNALMVKILPLQMENGFRFDAEIASVFFENLRDEDLWNSTAIRAGGAASTFADTMVGRKFTSTTQNINLPLIFCSFSYNELIAGFSEILGECKTGKRNAATVKSKKIELFVRHISCLMILSEKVRSTDINFFTNEMQLAPGKVKTSRALQPFLYAYFADYFHRRGIFSAVGNMAVDESSHMLLEIARSQHTIFRALFGHPADRGKLYDLALQCFISYRFRSSAALLWKLLHWKSMCPRTKKKSSELFIVAILTILVLQKRQNPKKHFAKIHEVSMVQAQYLQMLTGGRATFLQENFGLFILYRFFDDPLTDVYNLAAVCLKFHSRKAMTLLWKVLHAPNASSRIKFTCMVMFAHKFIAICENHLIQFLRKEKMLWSTG